jgi:hypothetical protein
MIERFVINVLCKGIISYLWVYAGARLDILWKGNITFLWVRENNFVLMIARDFVLVDHETCCVGKIISLSMHIKMSKSKVVRVLCVNLKERWS